MDAKKILIIRFSSIGDIILTTPVIRCLKAQLPGVKIHFITKHNFRELITHNPYVDKLHTFKEDVEELYSELSAEKFDLIIDLHKNLRSLRLRRELKVKTLSFDKINVPKLLAVYLKAIKVLPKKHIVDRYFDGLESIGIKDDAKGLDFFIPSADEIDVASKYFKSQPTKYIGLVVGGSYYTKKIPINKLREIIVNASLPVILLGGPEDKIISDQLTKEFPCLIDTCGNLTINQSASLVRQAEWLITSDTGLMHLGAAFHKKIISVWGNTIPEFGMSVYKPEPENKVLQINHLKCRPCSKLGYRKCPLGHFKCMNEIDYKFVSELK